MESNLRGELEDASVRREKSESEASNDCQTRLALTEAKIETKGKLRSIKAVFQTQAAVWERERAAAIKATPMQVAERVEEKENLGKRSRNKHSISRTSFMNRRRRRVHCGSMLRQSSIRRSSRFQSSQQLFRCLS
jgi:hypothetical protein